MRFRQLNLPVCAALFSIGHFGIMLAEDGGTDASNPTVAVDCIDFRFHYE
jgi:hypothetical protein